MLKNRATVIVGAGSPRPNMSGFGQAVGATPRWIGIKKLVVARS